MEFCIAAPPPPPANHGVTKGGRVEGEGARLGLSVRISISTAGGDREIEVNARPRQHPPPSARLKKTPAFFNFSVQRG